MAFLLLLQFWCLWHNALGLGGSVAHPLIGRYVFGGEMVREATKDDCVKLAALSIKVWLDTYAREGIKTEYAEYVLSTFTTTYFLEILDTIKYRVFVSEEQGVIQGYVMVNLESHYQTSSNGFEVEKLYVCLLYTSPSPRDNRVSRMPSSA